MEGAMDSGAELEGNFDSWLKQLLDSHDVDGEVFGEYISGTLSTIEDPTGDEITENLSDILSGCVEDEAVCTTMTAAITEKWMTEVARRKEEEAKEKELKQSSEAADHEKATVSQVKDIPSHDQKQTSAGAELGGLSEAEKKRLVAQYDCESDGDSDVAEDEVVKESRGKSTGTSSMQGLFQNVNASQVAEAVRQKKRDQKAAHEAKVERDKKSREAQKQKVQDRKEKEKKRTQKQEKRR